MGVGKGGERREERARWAALKDEGKCEEHGRGIRGVTNWLIFVKNSVIH